MKRVTIQGRCDLTVSMLGNVTIKGIDPDRAVVVIRRSRDPEHGDLFRAEEPGKEPALGGWRRSAADALAALEAPTNGGTDEHEN